MKERLVPALVAGLLLLGIPVAMQSVMFAAAILAAAALVVLLAALGMHRTSICLLVAAFALAPCVSFTVPGFRFFNFSDVLFAVAMVLSLPRLLTRHIWLPLTFVIGSMAFVTIAALASVQSSTPGASYYYAARVIVAFIGIPAMLVWWGPRGKVLVSLILAYATGAVASVVVGITQMGGWRSYGLTGHPNVLGYTVVLALALLPFLAKTLIEPYRTWICLTIFGFAGIGVWISGSRAALITAILLIVLIPAAERSIIAALAVVASGVVAILYVGQRSGTDGEGQDALSRLLGEGDVAGADKARMQGFEKVWDVALNHPFIGAGFRFDDFVGHNGYLQIAAAAGFLGLAAFLMVCLSMVTPMIAYDHTYSRLVYPIVVFMVAAPVSPNLTDRYIGLLLGLSLVAVVAVHESRLRPATDNMDDSVDDPLASTSTFAPISARYR